MNRDNLPPGWRYNPSSGSIRMPIVALALIGLVISIYLALYQLDVLNTIWDPFSGQGSEQTLTSLTQLPTKPGVPIPDTLFLVTGYLLVALLGTAGGPRRWRTRPWTVALMGWTAYLLALMHLLLVLLQPILFGVWSTLCLTSAAISFVILGLVIGEFVAAVHYVQRTSAGAQVAWKRFWGTGQRAGLEPGSGR